MNSLHSVVFSLLLVTTFVTFVKGVENEDIDPSKPRSCFSCLGINCYRTTATNVNRTCSDALDICVTVFDGFSVVARGCYLDLPEEHRSKCDGEANLECHKCFGQLCNDVGREDFKCLECDSSNNKNCKTDTSNIAPVRCPVPTAPNSYCYVQRKDDGNVQRGCSIRVSHQRECLQNAKCALCLPSDGLACNSFNLKSGAGNLKIGFGLVALLAVVSKLI